MAIPKISKELAKNVWIHSQKLNEPKAFGLGAEAVTKAVQHLGYVQIDTINVIERCHHHILYNRIPEYRPTYLKRAQSVDKTVFEYWTHALSYLPTKDFKFYVRQMKRVSAPGSSWYKKVSSQDYAKVKRLLKSGPISIRDIKDDVLVEKEHLWGSVKPSKKALQLGFYKGDFVIGERDGMLKKYDLTERHFGWTVKPKSIKETEYGVYLIDRALRAQGIISLDSICHLEQSERRKQVTKLIQKKIDLKELIEVEIQDSNKPHWIKPQILESKIEASRLVHILSPFDPLIIQRKRVSQFFDYNHLFEAYLPKEKRKYGYFTLPVLIGNNIEALLDLKADRENKKILINNWVWLNKNKSKEKKKQIEIELDRFSKFQFIEQK